MSASPAVVPIIDHLRGEPSRTWSIIVTVYGDAVVPRGGSLWLGTLLRIFEAMGIGGNVVRTAMSRLAADCWLERTRIGRNSFYRLTETGQRAVAEAAVRIYGAHEADWDGAFHLALLPAPPGNGNREAVREMFERANYAPLSPGIFLSAVPQRPLPSVPDAVHLRATTDAASARRLAGQVWSLERTEAGYHRFLQTFGPLRGALAQGTEFPPLDALLARLLMVHEYRRIVLRDPLLPQALLPEDWPGCAARALCAELYPRLLPGSERWLDEHAQNENGKLPAPARYLQDRFTAAPA